MAALLAPVLELPSPSWEQILQFLEEEEVLALPLIARRFHAQQDIAEILVEKEGFRLELVAPALRTQHFCCKAVRNCTGSKEDARRLFKKISATFAPQPDRELLVLMCLHFPSLIQEVLPKDTERRAFLLDALAYCEQQQLHSPGWTMWLGKEDILEHFPELAADREVVLRAVSVYGGNLCSASSELRRDEEVVRAALTAYGGYCCLEDIDETLLLRKGFLEEAAELLKDNMWTLAGYLQDWHLQLAQQAVRLAPIYGLRDLPRTLREDRRVWMEAVKQCPMALEYVPQDQVPVDVAEEAVKRCPRVFSLFTTCCRLGRSEELALMAFSRDGLLLGHNRLSYLWKHNKKIVLACVQQNGLAIEHASEQLRDDVEVVRAAVAQNGLALAYASRKRRHQGSIVSLAARQNFHALGFSCDCDHVVKRARREQWKAPGLPEETPRCRTGDCAWTYAWNSH